MLNYYKISLREETIPVFVFFVLEYKKNESNYKYISLLCFKERKACLFGKCDCFSFSYLSGQKERKYV